jgi:hypothetical protein
MIDVIFARKLLTALCERRKTLQIRKSAEANDVIYKIRDALLNRDSDDNYSPSIIGTWGAIGAGMGAGSLYSHHYNTRETDKAKLKRRASADFATREEIYNVIREMAERNNIPLQPFDQLDNAAMEYAKNKDIISARGYLQPMKNAVEPKSHVQGVHVNFGRARTPGSTLSTSVVHNSDYPLIHDLYLPTNSLETAAHEMGHVLDDHKTYYDVLNKTNSHDNARNVVNAKGLNYQVGYEGVPLKWGIGAGFRNVAAGHVPGLTQDVYKSLRGLPRTSANAIKGLVRHGPIGLGAGILGSGIYKSYETGDPAYAGESAILITL